MPNTTAMSERDLANAIRALAMDAVQAANSGHPGMPMGMADVATVLFREVLKFDARAAVAGSRPVRALGRARLDAALRAALSDRLSRHGDRRSQGVPAARIEDGRAPRAWPCARHRNHHGPTWPGPRQRGRHGAGGTAAVGAARFRTGRSPYLRHRWRWLPDGRHQPGGDLAGRASETLEVDRAVG